VRATGVRMEKKKKLILEIRSVQRDEFHRLGDIRVHGPINIKAGEAWRLRQVIQATVPAMAVLAEDELERSAGGFRHCEALQRHFRRGSQRERQKGARIRGSPQSISLGGRRWKSSLSLISKWIGRRRSREWTRDKRKES
jgi:hypothetical protein